MENQPVSPIAAALGAIPGGVFILTAEHEDRRAGMLASWVQQVCFEPPMVMVAVAKGRPIMPLISESRQFGLCQLSDKDKLLRRKFSGGTEPGDDPFLGFELAPTTLHNLPILKNCLAHLECELACHMDVEGDHDLFVGVVRGAARRPGAPEIRLRESGMEY
jgi:flavin reductase (DIM6/NTAB) family NADH-FMN oxidoreductase RutF